uniref:Uncharacterized protein n=1 Tax=viral metagenome TaxID=1070528 RepID=A0A6C0LQJ9_9ZZZZ
MQRIARGGVGISDFHISDILGNKLVEFIKIVDSSQQKSLLAFTCRNNKVSRPQGANDKDLHPQLFQYLIALGAALREIEHPSYEVSESASQFTSELKKYLNELLTFDKGDEIKYILNGIKQIPFETIAPGLNISQSTFAFAKLKEGSSFIRAIQYIGLFVINLNYDGAIDMTKSGIAFYLYGSDPQFRKLVDKVIDTLHNNLVFHSKVTKEDIQKNVLNGLSSIAGHLTNKIKHVKIEKTTLYNELIAAIDTFDGKTWLNLLSKATNDPPKAVAIENAIILAIVTVKNYSDPGNNIVNTYKLTADQIDNYILNGLFNIPYLDSNPTELLYENTATVSKPKQESFFGGTMTTDDNISPEQMRGSINPKQMYGGITDNQLRDGVEPDKAYVNSLYSPFIYCNNNAADGWDRILITKLALLNNVNVASTIILKPDPIADFKQLCTTIDATIDQYDWPGILTRAIVFELFTQRVLLKVTDTDFSAVNLLSQVKIALKKSVENYSLVYKRFQTIRNLILNTPKDLLPFFSTGFLKPVPSKLTKVKKINLKDPEIKKFYEQFIVQNSHFYGDFFNLVEMSTNQTVDLLKAHEDNNYTDYRLNVKTFVNNNEYLSLQKGGLSYKDIVILARIPPYDDTIYGDLWVNFENKITAADLANAGPDAIRLIVRGVYNQDINTTTVNFLGLDIQILDQINATIKFPNFEINFNEYYKFLIDSYRDGFPISGEWKMHEDKLRMKLWARDSKWRRVSGPGKGEFDVFVQLDSDDNVLPMSYTDNCAFVTKNANECANFLRDCALNKDKELGNECAKLINGSFTIDIVPNLLAEQIQKINPKVAYAILKKFGFGEKLEKTDEFNIPGRYLNRYIIESVGSWLKALPSLKNTIYRGVNDFTFESIGKNNVLLKYFEALVDWVNANSQVLNEEEDVDNKVRYREPELNKSFDLYWHHGLPRKSTLNSVKCQINGLDRLKSSIINDISGSRANGMISNIAFTPVGLNMPLNFLTTNPLVYPSGLNVMKGGEYPDVIDQLATINQATGYNLFNQIFNNLRAAMEAGDENGFKIKFNKESLAGIQTKLENFRELEIELRKSLERLIIKNRLYNASNGKIDAFRVPDDRLDEVLKKHSNLLHLSSVYNTKAYKIIDLLKTLAKIHEAKLEEKLEKKNKSSLLRPPTINYH